MFGYLRHYWSDKRFAGKSNKTIRLKGSTVEHAWTPDTYVSNSRQSNMRVKDSESECVLEIYSNGGVFYSKGLVKDPEGNTMYRVFSHDVTVAILVSQNNETAAMLVSQTSPLGVELFSYANAFFCSNKFA